MKYVYVWDDKCGKMFFFKTIKRYNKWARNLASEIKEESEDIINNRQDIINNRLSIAEILIDLKRNLRKEMFEE